MGSGLGLARSSGLDVPYTFRILEDAIKSQSGSGGVEGSQDDPVPSTSQDQSFRFRSGRSASLSQGRSGLSSGLGGSQAGLGSQGSHSLDSGSQGSLGSGLGKSHGSLGSGSQGLRHQVSGLGVAGFAARFSDLGFWDRSS